MRKLRRNSLLKVSVSLIAGVVAVLALEIAAQVRSASPQLGRSHTLPAAPKAGSLGSVRERGLLVGGGSARRALTRVGKAEPSVDSPEWIPPLFLSATRYSTGGPPTSVAVADVNNDGNPDIVLAECPYPNCTAGPGTVSVFLGNGDGTFEDAVSYESGGLNPTAVAVADVNGDGKPDILVTHEDSPSMGVLLGNGDGTFQMEDNLPPVGAEALMVADVNRDGKPDLVVMPGALGYCVGVLLGNGDGTFQPEFSYGGCFEPFESSLAVADVNEDGKRDVVVVYWETNSIVVLLGNGDGTFQNGVWYDSGGTWPGSLAVADLNGDGHLDLVVANTYGDLGTISVLLGNGDGTFQTPLNQGWDGFTGTSVAIADVNRDGKRDLVVGGVRCSESCGQGPHYAIGVLLGNGDGTFQATMAYASDDSGERGLAVIADFNGDGRPDLVDLPFEDFVTDFMVKLHVGKIHTDTTQASSRNPSTYGQAVTLTGTANSSSGTPTGTVEFFDNSNDYWGDCGGATLENGSGSIDILLSAGSHVIAAAYQGSLKFNSSVSTLLNQTVNMATTTTSLAASLNPAPFGQKVTYTATVTGQYGGEALGSVTFSDGGLTIATVTLKGNQAAYTSKQSCGVHSISATYSGDANNYGSTSEILKEYIQCSTSTTLSTSGSPTFVGQPVTFTAKVKSKIGIIPDGEPVTFYDGKTAIASVPLTGGTATYTTSSLSAKKHPIKAAYAGDGGFLPSTGWVTQEVLKYPTTTTLSSSSNPSQFGEPVIFTATVSSEGPTPTGKVIFKDGGTSLGKAILSGGVATLTKSNLAIGNHSITAYYLEDSFSAKSTSSVLNQVVQ